MADETPIQRLLRKLQDKLEDQLSKCARCARPLPAARADQDGWSVHDLGGYPTWLVCPDCQTPEEVAAREIRGATATYTLEKGRIVERPKVFDDDEQ